jgi:ATP-dependent Lhr-like helicase
MDPLSVFHPLVRAWFAEAYGSPTDIQARAWPLIAAGKHVLLTAPTGSGKTLTAFLWALDRFASGAWAPGATRILYVSPLKALNNDIQRNLFGPLEGLGRRFAEAGRAFPDVRALVRSGDTPATERRRMLRRPPEILITTPESLNLMLLSESGREALRDVKTVILDEVHAVAGSKRGVHLITAVDRLAPLAGEFQRIALTATVRPLTTVAAWVGGFALGETGYVPREVAVAESRTRKRYDLRVRYPVGDDGTPFAREPRDRAGAGPGPGPEEKDIWATIATEIKSRIASARSTLVFANNRRLAERLARLLNEGEEKPLAYAHHGSLSREIRSLVEERMKLGLLPAIVATNSLELGIDIGALDQVILVQTPFSVASTLQKIGRAGHGVGQTSHAVLFASHGKDLLDAAVAVRCALDGDLEETRPIEAPLDLLAQILVSLAASGEWTADRMYAFLKTSWPYRNLARRAFDAVLEMLAGRYEATRVRELRPRLFVDAVDGRVTAARGAALLLGLSGGTIPDRGLYALRHAESRAKIGELDEEFVWERREGEMFHLGNQSWRITNITANEVEAVPAERQAQMAPFWRADERDRGFHFAARLGDFLEAAEAELADPAFPADRAAYPLTPFAQRLAREFGLEPESAVLLIGYLRRQREATGAALPHRHHLLIEDAGESEGGEDPGEARQIILHAVWGGRALRPWAYALAEAYEQRQGRPLEVIASDDCLLVRLWPGDAPSDLLDLVHPDDVEGLLRKHLEKTGFYAAHFRENAARALLLPRSTPRARVPLWLNRLRSQNLLRAVSAFPDFPIAAETWRECLRDEFDLPALKAMLAEVRAGAIRVGEARTREPSPFAETLVWKRTNKWMYAGDRPVGGTGAAADLLKEIAFSAPLRPRIPRAVIAEFEAKSLRLAPGYAPQSADELVEWAKERVLIPWEEWRALLAAMTEARGGAGWDAAFRAHAAARLLAARLPGAARAGVAAVEVWPRLSAALALEPAASPSWFSALPPPEVTPELPWDGALPADPAALGPLSAAARAHLERLARPASWTAGAAGPAAAGETREGPDPAAVGDETGEDDAQAAVPLAPWVAQWLRAYGPVPLGFARDLFGAAFPLIEEALGELAEGDRVILDVLSADVAGREEAAERGEGPGPEACDAANLEALLRLMRRRARPAFAPRPAESLPHFLAAWQGAAEPARDAEGLQAALEKLFGYPAPAAAWEADLLPARVDRYLPSRLDELLRDSGLLWAGRGRERLLFAFPEDLELFPPAGAGGAAAGPAGAPLGREAALVLDLLREAAPGRLDYPALSARCPLPSDRIVAALWELAWRGDITNDTFAAVRKGLETGFKAAPLAPSDARGGPSRRRRFQSWKSTRPMAGAWLWLPAPETPADALAAEEISRDRARQLLRRYGVLFRELLAHELPALQWGAVFRSLRLLELSGEVLAGHFFEGVAGLQFLSPHALRLLESGLPASIWWISAADPASPCGLGLQGLPYETPPRVASTHLVFHGAALALVSRRFGRDLAVRAPPRHRYLGGYLACLRALAGREAFPQKAIETETVNGAPALDSPYLEDLLDAGFEKGFKTLSLRKGP